MSGTPEPIAAAHAAQGVGLRDLFAAAAMQSLLHPGVTPQWMREAYGTNSVSHAAYRIADSMLVARGAP